MNAKYGNVDYVVFIDGVQTVLLFSDNQQIIKTALNVCIIMNKYLEMFVLF